MDVPYLPCLSGNAPSLKPEPILISTNLQPWAVHNSDLFYTCIFNRESLGYRGAFDGKPPWITSTVTWQPISMLNPPARQEVCILRLVLSWLQELGWQDPYLCTQTTALTGNSNQGFTDATASDMYWRCQSKVYKTMQFIFRTSLQFTYGSRPVLENFSILEAPADEFPL